jgi:DNA topoisomerase-3
MKLVIAEKPSVAVAIANVLGVHNRKDGYITGNEYIVSWCVGHLVQSAMPEDYDPKYKLWKLGDLPILPESFKTVVIKETKAQFKVLSALMNSDKIDSIICATDAGREGELIFRLTYNKANCTKPFQRLWISSMEAKAIRKGFDDLRNGTDYNNLYYAALARMRADNVVGTNFSRLYSLLYNQNINIGRVQTPTVNLVVQRERDIANFVPTPYYVLEADCGDFVAISENIYDYDKVDLLYKSVNNNSAVVISVEEKQHKENPPTLFDLTTLQRTANKEYGYTAQQVLDIIQGLYEKKLLTYPRTDSKFLTDEMVDSTVEIIANILKSDAVTANKNLNINLNAVNIDRVVNNSKVSDHHAIIPTVTLAKSDYTVFENLSSAEINCLTLVINRLLAATYTPYLYSETIIKVEINGYIFTAKGKTVIDSGYKTILNENMSEHILPPGIVKGKEYTDVTVNCLNKATTPPKPYTDDTLLSAMENAGNTTDNSEYKAILKQCKGLGTPATRAGIIERIIKTGYIIRRNKNLIPTAKAVSLIDLLPDEIKSADLTAQWEMQLEEISSGKISSDEFISSIYKHVSDICNTKKSSTVDKSVFKEDNKSIGICPRCGKPIIEINKAYICTGGKDCGFILWKNDKFFTDKKKKLTTAMVKTLLSKGKVKVKDLYSAKKDKTYDAYVTYEDTGKYINFKLDFKR